MSVKVGYIVLKNIIFVTGLFDPQTMFAELKNIYIFVQMAWHFVRW